MKTDLSDGSRYFDATALEASARITREKALATKTTAKAEFTDPVTGEKLAIGTPPPKEDDQRHKRKGTALTPATSAQLSGLAAKFAK